MDSLYKQEDCKTCNTEKSPVKGRPDLVWINATKRIEEGQSLSRFMIQTEGKRPFDMPWGPSLHQEIHATFTLMSQDSFIQSAVAVSFAQGMIRR